jgi:hypothetical protein
MQDVETVKISQSFKDLPREPSDLAFLELAVLAEDATQRACFESMSSIGQLSDKGTKEASETKRTSRDIFEEDRDKVRALLAACHRMHPSND